MLTLFPVYPQDPHSAAYGMCKKTWVSSGAASVSTNSNTKSIREELTKSSS